MPGIPVPLLGYVEPDDYLALREQGINLAKGPKGTTQIAGDSGKTEAK